MDRLHDRENFEAITFPVAPLDCNCTIIRSRKTNDTALIDPGGEGPEIIARLQESGCHVRWIIHTHAHFDHCLATHEVAQHCRTIGGPELQVAMHKEDMLLYENLALQCSWFNLPPVEAAETITHFIEDEEEFIVGDLKIRALHTPGHTPGSCCFHLDDSGLLFSGDTLFAGSIGRSDLPGGNGDLLLKSIRNRLFTLDDGTFVIPGHGSDTRIYDEKKTNPFFS